MYMLACSCDEVDNLLINDSNYKIVIYEIPHTDYYSYLIINRVNGATRLADNVYDSSTRAMTEASKIVDNLSNQW